MSRQDEILRVDDPYEVVLSKYAISNSRTIIVSLLVIVALVCVIVGLGLLINRQMQLNEYLSANRIMFGFQGEDGTFISTNERPEWMIYRYAKEFAADTHTYDSDSIETNFNNAISMYDYRVRDKNWPKMQTLIESVNGSGISQSFFVKSRKLEETNNIYTVTFRGKIVQYVGNTPTGSGEYEVSVALAKITPTTSRKEGLSVLKTWDTPLAN
jgi:hypothetical protein